MTTLNIAKIGKVYKICDVTSPFKIKRRLFELGFIQKESVKVLRKSLLGQTFLVEIRGNIFSLRKDIVSNIWVD